MQIDPAELWRHARDELIRDECGMSHFAYADNFSELDLLRTTVEELVAREEAADVDRLATEAKALPGGASGEFWAENHPYWWDHIIAPQFRASFFIALMSALELHLGRLVRDAGIVVDAPISAEELKGGFYSRSRKFLSRFCAVESPGEHSWQRILSFYSVRNALVHAGGFVANKGDLQKLEAFATQVDGLVISSQHVELQAAFCAQAHRECRAFLDDVWGEVVLQCRKQDMGSPRR
jgi:hypothetical protein